MNKILPPFFSIKGEHRFGHVILKSFILFASARETIKIHKPHLTGPQQFRRSKSRFILGEMKYRGDKRFVSGPYEWLCFCGSLGDFKAHPKDLMVGPSWLKAFQGNELQRLIRKRKLVGERMMTQDRLNLDKRIRYLYRHFNRVGKYR